MVSFKLFNRPSLSNMDKPYFPKTPPLFDMPPEIFQNILDILPKRDILSLSRTCRKLKEAPIVLKAMYAELFDRDDLPLGTYKDYTVYHKPTFDTLLSGITTSTGSFVRHVAVHEWFTKADILHLFKYCPNLESVDFTGISEGIDSTRCAFRGIDESFSCYCPPTFRNMELCPATKAQFEWHDILNHRPQFFQNLKTIELNLLNKQTRYDPNLSKIENAKRKLMQRQLPQLLSLASSLQTLRLQYNPGGPGVSRRDHHVDEYLVGFSTSRILQQSILEYASENLMTLELRGFRLMIPNLHLFLQRLEPLPNLQTIVISVHHDMMLHTLSWYLFYQNCMPIRAPQFVRDRPKQQRMQNSTVTYVKMLNSISKRHRWELICADNGERYPMGPRAFYGFLEADNLELLDWLRTYLNWTPVFLWSEYICAQDRLLLVHLASLDEEMMLCRKLFEALKRMKIPIKLIIPPFRDGAIFTPMSGFRNPDGSRAAGYNEVTTNLSNWRLNSIGDLVDELSLRWGFTFGDMGRYPARVPETIAEHIARTEPLLKVQVDLELCKFRLFCKSLAANFPNLTRLALFIPAAMYPNYADRDNDADFAEYLLPGTGWRVKHYGSGGAMPYNTIDIEHEFGLRHRMRYPDYSNCVSDPNPHETPEYQQCKATWLRSQTRCPMIHRVFTRELPVSQSPVASS